MQDNHERKFKEKAPLDTIEQIKSFFNSLNIETKEEWAAENEIGTYSLRLSLKGAPGIGANGKGMTREYALASAYAEFMERLQNMRMSPISMLVRIRERNGGFFFHPSEKLLSIEEIVDEDSSFIRMFFGKRNLLDASRQEKMEALRKIQSYDYSAIHEFGKFLCIPFYSVREDKIYHIPYFISSIFYASNGMCAGNTVAEALVQGIAEIFERYANTRELESYTALPDIPEESIARYPEVNRMYRILHESDRFNIQIKDASFGGMFPVVALVLIEKNTGKFGVKFGAHPDVGIALERVFTEATQGISLEEFSHKSDLSFLNEMVDADSNIINSFRTSNAQYPYQMLCKPAQYTYHDFPMINSFTNEDLLKNELQKLLDHGYDILVNDYSYSGFGSYHVIIPGLSEIGMNDDDYINRMLERYSLQYALGHPTKLSKKICKMLVSHLMEAAGNVLENTLYYFSGIYSSYPYPGKDEYIDIFYLITVCAISVGEYGLASEIANFTVKRAKEISGEVKTDYLILKKYADGMHVLGEHSAVIEYLRYIFDDEMCEKYDMWFCEPECAVAKMYPEIWIDSEYASEFRKYEELILKFKEYEDTHQVNLTELKNTLIGLKLNGGNKGE